MYTILFFSLTIVYNLNFVTNFAYDRYTYPLLLSYLTNSTRAPRICTTRANDSNEPRLGE